VAQENSVAGEASGTYRSPMVNPSRRFHKLNRYTASWRPALVVGACLLIQAAPAGRADGCGDANGSAVGCGDAAPTPQLAPPPARPPWLAALEQRDPQFADSYLGTRERILKDGAIPAKYKLLIRLRLGRHLIGTEPSYYASSRSSLLFSSSTRETAPGDMVGKYPASPAC
jgi:hypothetical protein